MATDIIQHHGPFDFKTFYENISSGYVGIDYHDFETFMLSKGTKHSFIGESKGANRIQDASANAFSGNEDIIRQASSMLITVVRSPVASQPLMMEEMQFMNEFLSSLPDGCDVIWGLADESSLENGVRIIVLVNLR